MQLPSLSLIYSATFKTQTVPIWIREHTHTLLMRIQNYHLNKKDKNGLLSFIHLGKQKKKEKNIVQTGILRHKPIITLSHSHSHSYTFTKIFTSLTNPICLIFFVVFVMSFFRQVQIFKFFYNPFFNSFTFYINVKKMLNKRNINSVCLSRKGFAL